VRVRPQPTHFLTALHLPDPQRRIVRRAQHPPPIARKNDTPHIRRVPLHLHHQLAARHLAHTHTSIHTPDGRQCAITTERAARPQHRLRQRPHHTPRRGLHQRGPHLPHRQQNHRTIGRHRRALRRVLRTNLRHQTAIRNPPDLRRSRPSLRHHHIVLSTQ